MKYQDFINLIEQEVREEDAWPQDDSKVARQIELSYLAALAIGKELPLSRLTITESVLTIPDDSIKNKCLYKIDLPDNIYDLREDFGINRVVLNGDPLFLQEGITVPAIYTFSGSMYYIDESHFAIDDAGRLIYVLNPKTVSLYHAKLPSKPEDVDVNTADYPLEDKDAHRAVQIVAFHINGVTIRDTASAQFNALLEKQYGDQTQPQEAL